MANSIIDLIQNTSLKDGTWIEVTKSLGLFMLKFLVVAAINYPTFICIYSPYKFLASILGTLFMLSKMAFFFLSITDITCQQDTSEEIHITVLFIQYLPTIVCFLAVLFKFVTTFLKHLKQRSFGKIEEQSQLANDYHIRHFKELLRKDKFPIVAPRKVKWYKKPYQKIVDVYQGTLQYSILFLSSIAIILVSYYYILVTLVYVGATDIQGIPEILYKNFKTGDVPPFVISLGNGLVNSYFIAVISTVFFYTWLLVDLLQTHENNLRDLFAGKQKDEKVLKKLSPQTLTLYSIIFPGYFIAYMFWGFIVFFGVVFVVVLAVYGFILALVYYKGAEDVAIYCLKYIYLIFSLPLLAYLCQWLLVRFVLTQPADDVAENQKSVKKMQMLKNLNAYHVTMYIFFFYNLIVGFTSCVFRSIKGLLISLLVLGRIDQTPFAFLKRYDSGYCAYLGFLHLQGVYKNPVMRCFLQMLQDSVDPLISMESFTENETGRFKHLQERPPPQFFQQQQPLASSSGANRRLVRNRWFVAYTLIKNRHLVKERIHGDEHLTCTNCYKEQIGLPAQDLLL